ncbi:MAG: tRNA (adenosine(37)-N6)-threonylcarbamoyltransferase complex ATPase subunit type 1 TsaE [Flavobacteriales bacterium]|nr:tRNA (adenosine(37)-N6)-threonylcarbamoyltransferase complex ATPase subunit type 1 TsaE [Flavobacteriales bacterium]
MEKILEYNDVSLEKMHQIASQIASQIKEGTILFEGEMGAGKTTLIKDLVKCWGSDDVVTSPTFSIVNQYLTDKNKTIYHFDFYRIEDPSEAFDMGYEEYFYSSNICLVEWGERVKGLLPTESVVITIKKNENTRNISVFK